MASRLLTEDDKPMLAEWIAAEPDHKNSFPEFYYTPGTKSVLYEDEEGPVCVVRYSSALRLDMDFSPTAEKSRIIKTMRSELPEVAHQARQQGFRELIFDSLSKKLIAFCEKLGFVGSPDFRKVL